MRVIIQRVEHASVRISGQEVASINNGLLIFLGIEIQDEEEDAQWLCQKIYQLRIFNDAEGKMNLSTADVQGRFLVVSQFTLHASIKKGNRPSYTKAARPEGAIPLYQFFIDTLATISDTKIETGRFGADMKINLLNDGPVTLFMDSKNKE